MPTCEPKRGHLCGNSSLQPAQEKWTGVWRPNPALVSWGLGPPPHLFPHQVGGLPYPLHWNSLQDRDSFGGHFSPLGSQVPCV